MGREKFRNAGWGKEESKCLWRNGGVSYERVLETSLPAHREERLSIL
jgi:hypothetical protein